MPSNCTIHVKTDDLEGDYYPVAGADVLMLDMSARTNENGYATFECDLPQYGAMASVHRIGYKPASAYFSGTSTEDIEVYTTFEVASVDRVTEIFTDFNTSLTGGGNAMNWQNMTGTVQNHLDYVLIDPTTRSHLILGSDCDNLLSDFCSKRNGTYQETASPSADTNNPIQNWLCDEVQLSTELPLIGYLPDMAKYYYSATNETYLGEFQSPSEDFVIGLPCFMYGIYNTIDNGVDYHFVVSGTSGHVFESNHGTQLHNDGNLYHVINEMRITGTTVGTTFAVYFHQTAESASNYQLSQQPYSRLLISQQKLYLYNIMTDYWCCYDDQFSTDGYNHYNGPFGPVYK